MLSGTIGPQKIIKKSESLPRLPILREVESFSDVDVVWFIGPSFTFLSQAEGLPTSTYHNTSVFVGLPTYLKSER